MALAERVAVISGATGGLGRIAALALAGQGVRLALLGRDATRLEALAQELALPAERLLAHAADLRDPGTVQSASEAVFEHFGRADILLHLVGGWTGGKPLAEAEAGDLEAMLAQHVWTTLYLIQAFTPRMLANHWGRVIVVSSPFAVRPAANGGLYAAAKAAQEALILSLAQEVSDSRAATPTANRQASGVTANILQVRTIDLEHARLTVPDARNASWTTPEEIAAAILYLCSDEAGMINGVRLPLVGGPG